MSYDYLPSAATLYVKTVLDNSRRYIPDYFYKTLEQRLAGKGAGSVYEQFSTPEELLTALMKADWAETTHEAVMAECRAFVAPIPGRFGLVRIMDQPATTMFMADDRKGVGNVSLTVKGIMGHLVPETYLITGQDNGHTVVFTFHPGEPIRPSQVKTTALPHGSLVSKALALKMGFEWAKIVA